MPQSRHRYWTGRPAFFGGGFRAEETCHPEKLDQVEVMESEWIHLKLFSHASITVVGLTSDLGCRSSTIGNPQFFLRYFPPTPPRIIPHPYSHSIVLRHVTP